MVDPAGLTLGIAAILVPAYEGYQRCSTVIADARNFPRKFRTFKLALKTQKDIFSGECELLLKGFVDNSVLQEMLGDQRHEKWEDAGFQASFYDHLEGSLEDKLAPFKVVRETLGEIMNEVSEFEGRINAGPDTTTSTQFLALAEASQRVKDIKHRVEWALSKRSRLRDLVETLRKQNAVLFQLRNQAEAKARLKYIPQQGNVLGQSATPPPPEYSMVQEVSMELQKALADTATCHCHIVNLRLDSEPRDPACPRFHFVLTEDPEVCASNQSIIQHRCICLLVESHPGTVCLSSGDPIGTVATTTSQAILEAIDDLLVSASRVSLSSLLSSLNISEKQKLLPRGDRLKLGLALSLSVLHFGSYTNSWFKEHWRSQDICFFDNTGRHGLLSIGSPYVATSFSSYPENRSSNLLAESDHHLDTPRAGTNLARNEQLFSLAIVLIEIAYGDLLCNILRDGNQITRGSERLDGFAEYLKAKQVSDFIGREMGKKYADVVKRCLFCDFGVDESDLSKRQLQEAFFNNVICKLEQCMKQFSD